MAHTPMLASPMPPPSRMPPAARAALRWPRIRLTAALIRAGAGSADSASTLHGQHRPPRLPSRGSSSSLTLSAARESSGRRVGGKACAAAMRAGMPRASAPCAPCVAAARRRCSARFEAVPRTTLRMAEVEVGLRRGGGGGREKISGRNSRRRGRPGRRARRRGGGEWPRDGSSMLESVGFGARGAHNGAHIGEIARENPRGNE